MLTIQDFTSVIVLPVGISGYKPACIGISGFSCLTDSIANIAQRLVHDSMVKSIPNYADTLPSLDGMGSYLILIIIKVKYFLSQTNGFI